jgi:predicted nucleic acid-binding protein
MIIDSNIVIDLLQADDDQFAKASLECFAYHSARSRTYVNHVIIAETASRTDDRAGYERWLVDQRIRILPFDTGDAFRAGAAFLAYRHNGGPRTSILPDFLIGAQAAVRGWPILTRDPKRFASYFPEVELIDPLEASA